LSIFSQISDNKHDLFISNDEKSKMAGIRLAATLQKQAHKKPL